MFGHDNQNDDTNTQSTPLPFDPSTVSLSSDQAAGATTPTIPAPAPAVDPMPAPAPAAVDDNHLLEDGHDDLLGIKQNALQQLSPLVDHLEQTPEEKFKTTMMMIQASDDQSLIQTAYQAAQAIKDDKVRAQALLDIINEINYFTQHSNNES